MDVTHALAAGMGGIRTAGDLVARMQMTRGMRLDEAKQYVAGKLGCTVGDLSDSYAMEQIRGEKGLGRILDHSNLHPGEPNAMYAKFRIAELLGRPDQLRGAVQGPRRDLTAAEQVSRARPPLRPAAPAGAARALPRPRRGRWARAGCRRRGS